MMAKIIPANYSNLFITQSKTIHLAGMSEWEKNAVFIGQKNSDVYFFSTFSDNALDNSSRRDRNVFSKITTISKSIGSPYATLPRKLNSNPFVEVPNPSFAIEYKKGYIRRKCCYDANGKKGIYIPWCLFYINKSFACFDLALFGRRGWKLFYATLRDLVLYLHKDENGFRKSQLQESFTNSIRIHHSIASIANDYPKRKFVFRLITADYAEYLFETRFVCSLSQYYFLFIKHSPLSIWQNKINGSDSRELQSWVDTINTIAASLSAPSLPMAVSSDNYKFKREIFPVSHTKLSLVCN